MAAVLRQSLGGSQISTTTIVLTFPSAVLPGSLLVAMGGASTTGRTMSASDNVNGSYNIDKAAVSSLAIMSFPNTGGGTPAVTITISGAAVGSLQGVIEEWTGVVTTSPLDVTQNNSGAAQTSGNTGTTAALAQTNELALGCLIGNTTPGANFLVTSPFTADPQAPQAPSGANEFLQVGYNLVGNSTAGQVMAATWTNSVNYRACIATYKTVQLGQIAPYYNRKNVLYFI